LQESQGPFKIPSWVLEVFERFSKCELTTLSRGRPVTFPVTPDFDEEKQVVIITPSIGAYKKTVNMQRDPRVAVLYSNPRGSNLGYSPTVLVQGLAEVFDEDLDRPWQKYRAAHERKSQQLVGELEQRGNRPAYLYKRFVVEITPMRVFAWKNGDLNELPDVSEVRAPR
jgi:hypothetical protein